MLNLGSTTSTPDFVLYQSKIKVTKKFTSLYAQILTFNIYFVNTYIKSLHTFYKKVDFC